MKVTGNNLTNVCMVVYKVAKTEKNDQLFLEEDILSKMRTFYLVVYRMVVEPSVILFPLCNLNIYKNL